MPSKFEQYENLVESYQNHPDQGLKLCKKKLQRDPNNTIFLLAQAQFFVASWRGQDALASCDAIRASPKDPLEPLIILEIQGIIAKCQRSLGNISVLGGPKLSALWKDALDQSPKQWLKELRSEMFRGAVKDEYWDLAQQLFARLQREYPMTARYHFAWIALSQIQADQLMQDDKTSQSLKMLAYRSMKAAVDNTISKKDTPRTIASTSELRLLSQVYGEQGFNEELLSVLDRADIGITSEVGKHDVEFIRVKISLLEELGRWDKLKEFCVTGLDSLCRHHEESKSNSDDVPGQLAWADDWHVWSQALLASSKISTSESPEDMLQLIKRYQTINPKNRNAGRASLLYSSLYEKAALVDACKAFFKIHRIKWPCFEDLRSVIEKLDSQQHAEFDSYVYASTGSRPSTESDEKSVLQWIISSINLLKIRYLLRVSPSRPQDETEESFILDCLKTYKISSKEVDEAGDDSCILAIITLLQLATKVPEKQDSRHAIACISQAACLVSFLRDNSPNNYQATLLHLLVSRLLGLVSISMAEFRELSIREVQYDTLSHLIYARICTLHPYTVSLRNVKALDDRHKDPLEGMGFAQQWGPKAIGSTLNFVSKDLENVYFDKLSEFVQFKKRISNSYTPFFLTIERRRTARLTDKAPALESPLLHFNHAESDNRDFYSIPDFEHSSSTRFSDLITGGHKPGKYWVARFQLNELLQVLLTSKSPVPEAHTRIFLDAITYLNEHHDAKASELTPQENEITQGWDLLIPVVVFLTLGPSKPHASKDLKKDITAITNFLSIAPMALETARLSLSEDGHLSFTHWTLFHTWFLHLEFVKACHKLADAAAALAKQKTHHAFGKISADALLGIRKTGKKLAESVQGQARELKGRLEREGRKRVVEMMGGGGKVGEMIEGLVGEEGMRKYADEMVESAVEALEGVLKTRIG